MTDVKHSRQEQGLGLLKAAEHIRSEQPEDIKKKSSEEAIEPTTYEPIADVSDSAEFDSDTLDRRIEEIRASAEAPVRFFSEYARAAGLNKGALLLYDSERELYAPWAITGFDVTTTHKLRIPLFTVNDHFSPLTAFRGNREKAEFLRDYFSVREFDSIEELLVIPFHRNDSVIGLLLIAEARCSYDDQVDFLLSKLDVLSSFMYESRELFYTKPAGTVYSHDQAYDETEALIEKTRREQNNLLVIKLDIQSIIEHLSSRLDRADSYRLRKDVLSLISSMVRGSGKVIHSTDSHAILLIETKSLTQGRLLLHQIYNRLNGFFSLNEALPALSSSERVLSRDGDTAKSLLEGFI